MSEMKLKVKVLDPRAKVPSKRKEDSGYDLYVVEDKDIITLFPGQSYLFSTKIAVQVPVGYGFVIANRGSVGSKGLVYGAHIVDSGYRDGIFVDLHNISDKIIVVSDLDEVLVRKQLEEDYSECAEWLMAGAELLVIKKSKAIAQAMILKTEHFEVEVVDELDNNSERGTGALGSSNK